MKLISFDDLKSVKGIRFTKTHIYRLIRKKQFPKPIRLGAHRVAFVESEIDAFLQAKIAERDQEAA